MKPEGKRIRSQLRKGYLSKMPISKSIKDYAVGSSTPDFRVRMLANSITTATIQSVREGQGHVQNKQDD